MTQRHLDEQLAAQRDAFIAEHDATFDFEAEWAAITARADTAPTAAPVARPADDDELAVVAAVDPDRRPARRRVLAGAGSLAAAALAVTALVVAGGDDQADAVEQRIIASTRMALAESVEHEVVDWDFTAHPIDDEVWRDQTTARVRVLSYSQDGSGISLDWGPEVAPAPSETEPPGGTWPQLAVDHCFGEYSVEDLHPEGVSGGINASIATGLIEGLEDGSMRTDGTEVVDGREYLRVVGTDGSYAAVFYVDPESHRPRLIVDEEEGYRTTIEYLPRTPEVLASFRPVIPAGTTEVDELTRRHDTAPCV